MQREMKKYLSFGAGVNSVALLLLLTEQKEKFETVFVNHGGDYPETYEYIAYLRTKKYEITEITPNHLGCRTIEEYIYKYNFMPQRFKRWCTVNFKIKPFISYIERPCVVYLGFDFSESTRIERKKPEEHIDYQFPLFDFKMTREDCIKKIRKAGLDLPQRSGCWFCPFQTKQQIRDLFLTHPVKFAKLKEMEWNTSKNGRYFLREKPVSEIGMEKTPALTSYFDKKEKEIEKE